MTTPQFDLAYWMMERENIRTRKAAGLPPPWTGDPIMATTRWCNVRREDDKVTRWMRTYWSAAESPAWWFVLGRMLNHIPTLEQVVKLDAKWAGLPGLDAVGDCLKDLRHAGHKVFTSAYTISTCGAKMDKIDYVMAVVGRVRARENAAFGSIPVGQLHLMAHALQTVPGLGSFLAGQVVADMKNTKGHLLAKANDWHIWATPGPGSLRGLSAYHGKPVTARNFYSALVKTKEEVTPLLPPSLHNLCMQDWQNCMCEFSKYIKIRNGEGHARNKYRPG